MHPEIEAQFVCNSLRWPILRSRQVRKMTAAVGFPTLRLVRVRIGNVLLNDLNAGDVVEVDGFEIEK